VSLPPKALLPRLIHPIAGAVAMLTIATFWLSTALSELFASQATVVAVKTAIPWGFLLLVPALAATGGSGFALAKGQRSGLVGTKQKRMPFIAANGVLVLIPVALFLAAKARAGAFDATFYTVQVLELVAGAVNLTLLGLNMRDGLALTQWRRRSALGAATVGSAQLTGRGEVAQGTLALRVSKPQGFGFKAGQAVYLSLPGLTQADAKGRVRTFSIASAPHEAELTLATRLTDSRLKHHLAAAAIGEPIQIEGPYGDLTLHDDAARPAVFLAGGIGITPIRSMILDALHRALPQRLYLFYSNRRPEDAAFLAELQALAHQHPQFTLIATFTDAALPPGAGERGRITAELMARHVDDPAAPIYYLAGPPAMVAAMQDVLAQAGINPAQVRAEAFSGY